jgi:replicative DNA helicase
MGKEKFNAKFLLTLFAKALENKSIASIMSEYVDEEYLPNKEYQAIFKAIKKELKIHSRIPTLNLLFQKFDDDDDVYDLLVDIEEVEINLSTEQILEELQTFLENAQFIQEYTEMGKLYNKGKKSEAVNRLKELSQKMEKFSIKSEVFDPVFSGFSERNIDAMSERALDQSKYDRDILFGIEELDELVQGIERQQVICFMAASGGGKTKAMRWVATTNARLGANVLHIQLEGSHKEALAGYGATASGVHARTLMQGLIDAEKLSDLEGAFSTIEGEIYVRTFEQFAKSPTTSDVHKMIAEVQKANNVKIDLVVIDYMELLDTAGGQRWSPNDERHRRTKIADELKDIAVEYDTVVLTATQANDVPPSDLNNDSFILSRHNVSEAKGIIKPLTMFLTINRTFDETQEGRARIFLDKSRFTSSNKVFTIATDYGADRFYDRKKTREIMQINE